jgi:hypothetical protein
MPDEERQLMNYRKGDDLVHGAMGPHPKLDAGRRETMTHEVRPDRDSPGEPLQADKKAAGRWGGCNFHVLTVASLTPDQADALLTGNVEGVDFDGVRALERAVVDIEYPLHHTVTVAIAPGTRGGRPWMSAGYILWQTAQAYEQLYREEAVDGRHGVWGHCLNDLYFEGIRPHSTGYCELDIGS